MPAATDFLKLNINLLVINAIDVVGSVEGPREPIKRIDFSNKKYVFPIIEEYPFEEMPKAFEKLEHGRPHFRCIVSMKDFAAKKGLKK